MKPENNTQKLISTDHHLNMAMCVQMKIVLSNYIKIYDSAHIEAKHSLYWIGLCVTIYDASLKKTYCTLDYLTSL